LPYITVDLPVCNRCNHVWLPELLPGEKPARLINLKWVPGQRDIPARCANCKNPYWNSRRKHKRHTRPLARKPRSTPEQMAARVKSMSGAEIFDKVMKNIKPK